MTASESLGVSATDDITQSPSSVITSNGETTLSSTTGDVTLDGENDFQGTVNASGANVALNDVNGIELGTITASESLGVSATDDITQSPSSVITSNGETTLSSTTGDVTLDGENDFQGTVNASGANVALNDVNGIELGTITASESLGVSATDDITQSPSSVITSNGETTLSSTTGDVTLDGENDFQGTVNASGANVALNDVNGIELGTISASESLGVSATDDITQSPSSVITSNGETTLSSTTGDVTLDGENDFQGTVNASGANVALNDVNGIELGTITASESLGVSATDDITQSPSSVITSNGETTLSSTTGDVTLDGENDFQGTVNASGANVALNDVNGIELGTITASESLGVSATDDITQSPSSVITSNGETTLSSTTGDVTLDGENDFQGTVNASGANVALNDVNGIELGTITASESLGVSATA
ncbi:beta strand repeat-containing protein [Arcobacter sp. L]|uniref:beta strand repeat-containing protein n=1 Tax=Arcobacter sp. L TaxID=944547 RepID=UPI00352B9990